MKTEKIDTKQIGDKFIHYTCNQPGEDTCSKKGILQIGLDFGLQACEVLLIPVKLIVGGLSKNPDVAKIQGEQLMKNLSRNK